MGTLQTEASKDNSAQMSGIRVRQGKQCLFSDHYEFVVQQGEILYCKKRGVTKCCYQGEKCRLTPYVGDREEILLK